MLDWMGRVLARRCRVEEFLSRGGMADVYKAWDEERAGYLTQKPLRDEDRHFSCRFLREDEHFPRLQHPDLVRFYGLEEDEDLACILLETSTATTMFGAGTSANKAPEQVRGEEPRLATDVYTLGVALYEMITGGETPFTGESGGATGTKTEEKRRVYQHPSPPAPSEFNPCLASGLDDFVMRCLEKPAKVCYPEVTSFWNDLEKISAAYSYAQNALPSLSSTEIKEASYVSLPNEKDTIRGSPDIPLPDETEIEENYPCFMHIAVIQNLRTGLQSLKSIHCMERGLSDICNISLQANISPNVK